MIRHTVVFKLKYSKGSREEAVFLHAAGKLSDIPGISKFECLLQTNKKTDFDYGLSMEFETQEAFDEYNQHADHTAFVQTYWATCVEKFLEIDYRLIE